MPKQLFYNMNDDNDDGWTVISKKPRKQKNANNSNGRPEPNQSKKSTNTKKVAIDSKISKVKKKIKIFKNRANPWISFPVNTFVSSRLILKSILSWKAKLIFIRVEQEKEWKTFIEQEIHWNLIIKVSNKTMFGELFVIFFSSFFSFFFLF